VANGIRTDAFAGSATKDKKDASLALVITVLEKTWRRFQIFAPSGQRASSSCGPWLGRQDPRLGSHLKKLVFHFTSKDDPNYDLNYLVTDQLGRFVWMENLLRPEDKNQIEAGMLSPQFVSRPGSGLAFYGLIKSGSEDSLFQQWKKIKKKRQPRPTTRNKKTNPLASLMTTAFRPP